MLLLGLGAAQRRSEIAALTTNDISRQDAGLLLRIRRSKTDQTGRGDLIGIPLGTHPETCPVLALEAWLEASRRKLGDGSPCSPASTTTPASPILHCRAARSPASS